jgi:protein-disulfide isomerase
VSDDNDEDEDDTFAGGDGNGEGDGDGMAMVAFTEALGNNNDVNGTGAFTGNDGG